MKKLMMGLFAGFVAAQIYAADLTWSTDLPKALVQAKAEKKLVFMDFTGSDWCPGCILFHKQVASSPAFAAFATNNLVLVEVDFPNDKPQSNELKAANNALQSKYDIQGFPTFILLNADGKELGRVTGFDPAKADEFIPQLKKISQQ